MPLRCTGETRSPTQTDDDSDDDARDVMSFWQEAPDSILLHIFSFLDVRDLGFLCQTCKTWKRISLDESLWKNLLQGYLGITECTLPPDKQSWRMEVKRFLNHRPVLLTETLHDHKDEVLHVSFSHDGKLFSTTSKDATLKIWTLGNPTTLKYTKDFRELLGWDFTQYSCFNESDTMVLVSSVKTTSYMDRRGYMAVLSVVHDFEILKIVTMDPSQLFGAWLDDTTFLGGNLEISLDRFATTVQIEAYDVPEIFSPCPKSSSPVIEESLGQTLFTFSSETASLIKFLTVAFIKQPPSQSDEDREKAFIQEKSLTELSPSQHACTPDQPSCSYGLGVAGRESLPSCSYGLGATGRESPAASGHSIEAYHDGDDYAISVDGIDGDSVHHMQVGDDLMEGSELQDKCLNCGTDNVSDEKLEASVKSKFFCDILKSKNSVLNSAFKDSGKEMRSDITHNKLKEDSCEKLSGRSNESQFSVCKRPKSLRNRLKESNSTTRTDNSLGDSLSRKKSNTFVCDNKKNIEMQQKNLIFVTGEFAVALHQLGFKNVPPYIRESVLSRGITPLDEDNPESFMVVNYSNNDVHFVQRQQEPDKPDSLLDLHGHVTGMCLTADQRYLFINCRPWIGQVDRTDPWATPDLSTHLEIRIIDLTTLKDLGVRYKGHKGFSSSNMCCFVFLDVSQDYVASGSEDALGYLWDKHYGALVAKFEHDSGVVNAVSFSPTNQEVLVTVSDDWTIKIWRSKHEANTFFENSV